MFLSQHDDPNWGHGGHACMQRVSEAIQMNYDEGKVATDTNILYLEPDTDPN